MIRFCINIVFLVKRKFSKHQCEICANFTK